MTADEFADLPTIDVRTIPPHERHPRIFSVLGALKPSQSLAIVSDHEPLPLQNQIQSGFPGLSTGRMSSRDRRSGALLFPAKWEAVPNAAAAPDAVMHAAPTDPDVSSKRHEDRKVTGTTLSRWTMAYFSVALLSLLAAEALMASGYGFPSDGLIAPSTLVVVHLAAVGWLSLLMCGALFQFVPVLVNRPVAGAGMMLPALLSIVLGLASLLTGFVSMGGQLDTAVPFLAIGGLLLCLGFAVAAGMMVLTIVGSRPLPLPAAFVAVGLASLLAAAALGFVFTGARGYRIDVRAREYRGRRGFNSCRRRIRGLAGNVHGRRFLPPFPMFLLSPDPKGSAPASPSRLPRWRW